MYMVIFGLKDVCKNKDCIGNCLKGHVFLWESIENVKVVEWNS